jgi:hypothetical protein
MMHKIKKKQRLPGFDPKRIGGDHEYNAKKTSVSSLVRRELGVLISEAIFFSRSWVIS